jgi:hypothetical protein
VAKSREIEAASALGTTHTPAALGVGFYFR